MSKDTALKTIYGTLPLDAKYSAFLGTFRPFKSGLTPSYVDEKPSPADLKNHITLEDHQRYRFKGKSEMRADFEVLN